jgi:plastocyanin
VRRPRIVAAVLALVSLIALGACGGDADAGSAGGADDGAPFKVSGEPVATEKVDLPRSYKFEPAVITVAPGTTVTWENKDDFPHNVKVFGENEQTEDLPIGGAAEIEFAEAGTYYYQCTLHPDQMKGKILVEA